VRHVEFRKFVNESTLLHIAFRSVYNLP
jgi:hypothetical protein